MLGTADDARRLARELRPEALDALGLVPALTNLVERVAAQTGLRFERELDRDLPPIGTNEELVVYRVAQESITNAIRHAHAQTVFVALSCKDGYVSLVVRDDGHGLSAGAVNGSGIRTMRERALTIGARLNVGAHPDGGTLVRLDVEAECG